MSQSRHTEVMAARPTRVRIDLRAIQHNAREVRRLLDAAGASSSLMAVVKADAYGHGAVEVSRALAAIADEVRLEALGVALVEEGEELREAGLDLPIVVLSVSYGPESWARIVAARLTPVVYAPEHVRALAAAVPGDSRYPVHLKVDTGMGRVGVLPEALPALLEVLHSESSLSLDGVLTHYASSDEVDPAVTLAQAAVFEAAVSQVRAAGFTPKWLHLSNSSALVRMAGTPEVASLVRPGLMLYGYLPNGEFTGDVDLRPALTWVTQLVHVKGVPAGFKVSYGQTWTARRQSVIGTLAVGYADGYDRRHSNGSPVLVRGQRCEVVGRVCMDLTMVDLTDVPGAQVGDQVVLLGRQGEGYVGADELAERIGSIPYEVLCDIGARVPREHP